jgi:rhamnogalacturonyl hydrolase YesR
MKHIRFFLVILLVVFFNCSGKDEPVKSAFDFADKQLRVALDTINQAIDPDKPNNVEPRTIKSNGNISLVGVGDWTCGFFPGELCSYGNGYRLTGNEKYREILLQSAQSLIKRYRPEVGLIRSWNWDNNEVWQYPVIIDNMMNLELLFWASKESGDPIYHDIAVSHAKKTLENHFRKNSSSYHVVDYDTITGKAVQKHTHQGYAHESAWARGQAWGVYGFTVCYRETKDPAFLQKAKEIVAFIFNNPHLPSDLIPYWDYDAPEIPNEPRDASAAAITASALYELYLYDSEHAEQYKKWADTILENLKRKQNSCI